MKKREAAERPTANSYMSTSAFPKEFECRELLAEFLTSTRWDDGTERLPGSMTIYYSNGRIGLSINDKAQECVCYGTVPLGGSVLDLAEQMLGDESTVWRESRPTVRKK
jgi:hypothetical protein